LVVGHVLHVLNLTEALLATNLSRSLASKSFLLRLTALYIGLIKTFSETDSLEVGVTLISLKLQGLRSEGVGIRVGLVTHRESLALSLKSRIK